MFRSSKYEELGKFGQLVSKKRKLFAVQIVSRPENAASTWRFGGFRQRNGSPNGKSLPVCGATKRASGRRAPAEESGREESRAGFLEIPPAVRIQARLHQTPGQPRAPGGRPVHQRSRRRLCRPSKRARLFAERHRQRGRELWRDSGWIRQRLP